MSRQVGACKRQKYDAETLEHAAGLVRAKSISLNQAAKTYGVPKTTLQNAVHNKYSGHKVGHKTVLTELEEQRIADWATHMARIGYGRTRRELVNTVKKILDEDGRPNPFKENRPGKEWLNGFFRRHTDLHLRTTIQLGKERALISPEKIEKWFSDFRTYIEEEVGDKDLLQDPSRIYNAGESGISLCMKGTQVIGIKGAPVTYHFGNSDKSQLTIMAACSASAHYVTPLIIFPGQRFSYNPLEGFEEAALGRSENGWMDSTVFCHWLENVFIPAVDERNVKKPVLLLIDGHSTHVTMEASNMCIQNGVEMYCLLEHASHLIQPLDLRLFSSLKKTWRQAVRDWQSENIGEYVTKVTFARVFKNAWKQSTTTEAAVKGFREAGLYPLDPSVVSSSVKIEPSILFASLTPKTGITETVTRPEELASTSDPGTMGHELVENGVSNIQNETQNNVSKLSLDKSNDRHAEKAEDEQRGTESVANNKQGTVVTASPFSKHLNIPTPKPKVASKAIKRIPIPKAITGNAYRQLMQEKLAQKQADDLAKELRKTERLQKRKLKEEALLKKKAEVEAKRKKRAEEKKQKREAREKLIRSLEESGSESEDAVPIDRQKCYACEKCYSTDYIACETCFRRFHIECVADEYLSVDGFECKYC